jgi:2-haloacid dehalogenase
MNERRLAGIKACVFDAYGTLFDVNAAAQHCAQELGDKWQPLADMWRLRQLEYSWLRSLMGAYVSFWQVTGDALDFAMERVGVKDENGLRQRLLDLYMQLDAYEEVADVLSALKAKGLQTAILSNGSPEMLQSAVDNAGIGASLDAVLSAHELRIFKTAPQVYQMAVDRLGVAAEEISFQSSNAWDAHAASNFGMRVVWVNRFSQPPERLPGAPDVELSSLHDLPAIVA